VSEKALKKLRRCRSNGWEVVKVDRKIPATTINFSSYLDVPTMYFKIKIHYACKYECVSDWLWILMEKNLWMLYFSDNRNLACSLLRVLKNINLANKGQACATFKRRIKRAKRV
jgi:hypothetical protein